MAMAILFDLRLDRPYQEHPCRELDACKAYSYPIKEIAHTTSRTNEERRAVLGCYGVSATIAWFMKSKPVAWTAHMEECLQHLNEHPETPRDNILVVITKLIKLVNEIHGISTWRQIETTASQEMPPPMIYVKSLRGSLEEIKSLAAPEILTNTTAMINELPLCPVDPLASMRGVVDFGRTECFYSCLQATKRVIENFFVFTPEAVFGHPIMLHLHFSRSTHILYRLSLMDDPAWDRGAISNTIDLLGSLDQCASLYESVPAVMGLDTDGSDIYTKASGILKATIPMWRRALEEAGAIPPTAEAQYGNVGTFARHEDMLDSVTDGWFTDMLSFNDTFQFAL
ncbi:hypothetical protein QQS21_001279 [Conoideocrella luteorostrata]|uniref:Uncharacterized protein n=1 Tax=Conoideocrella luteorostrata TaxID=1105319 RepID=A0AAJ0CX88_9HYPO|nr:hypothetical protein QQS21_001279 [Conoideocrella luteorostrata]